MRKDGLHLWRDIKECLMNSEEAHVSSTKSRKVSRAVSKTMVES